MYLWPLNFSCSVIKQPLSRIQSSIFQEESRIIQTHHYLPLVSRYQHQFQEQNPMIRTRESLIIQKHHYLYLASNCQYQFQAYTIMIESLHLPSILDLICFIAATNFLQTNLHICGIDLFLILTVLGRLIPITKTYVNPILTRYSPRW